MVLKGAIISLFLVLIFCVGSRSFHWQVIERTNYCGGAAPNEEVLYSNRKPKPYANEKVYLYIKSKCVDSLTTDSKGNIDKRLKNGKYALYLPYKHFKKAPYGKLDLYQLDCLKEEWGAPDGALDISWRGTVLLNKRIGLVLCPWQFNCLKEIHIPPSAPGQN